MINQIINKCTDLGIRLWCEEGKLHYKAPQGVLDNETLNVIKKYKTEIMSYLYKKKCEKLVKIAKNNDDIKYATAYKVSDAVDDDRIILNVQLSDSDLNGLKYNYKKLKNTCLNTSKGFTDKLNKNLLNDWVDTAEYTALSEIMNLFVKKGIFIDNDTYYTEDEIIDKIGVSDKYKKFLQRWLYIFTHEEILEKNDNSYRLLNKYNKDFNPKDGWKKLYQLEEKLHYGEGFVNYLKKCCENLEELFKADLSPLELLFPQGDTKVAIDTYQNTLTSKILNKIASECALNLVTQCDGKEDVFRILEIGAGVGGTSDSIIETLKGQNIEYYYTDVSEFFLNNAKKRYSGINNVKYGIFDINKGINQNIVKGVKFDLIVCANVLHNAKNGPEILELMKKLAVDNGAAIILDAIREPYYFLTSIEFNDGLRDFEDCRKKNDAIFFERYQWMQMFDETNIDVIAAIPEESEDWYKFGQGIFIVNLNKKENKVLMNIKDYLKENINDRDMPYKIEFTKYKGKNNELCSISKDDSNKNNISVNIDYEKPIGKMECKLENIWCSVLNKKIIGRNENFFLIGGDSLLVSQVVARMWEEIPETLSMQWGDIVKEMLKTPTIAEMAKKIEEVNYDRKITKFECVPLLTGYEKEDAVIYVFFHAGTGTLSPYLESLDLIKKSDFRANILGFTYLDYKEYTKLDVKELFKNLGKKYAQELLKQGKKKFVLVGHCIGGLIALEAARELKKNNIEVEEVVLISTNLPNKISHANYDLSEFSSDIILEKIFGTLIGADVRKAGYIIDDIKLKNALRKIKENKQSLFEEEDLCLLTGEFKDVSECYSNLLKLTHNERLMKIYNTLDNYDNTVIESKKNMISIIYDIFKHNFLATVYYEPFVYEGKSHVLKCKEETQNFYINVSDQFSDKKCIWSNYLGKNMIFEYIDGDHISCMNSPYIKDNLKKIVKKI